MVNWAKLTILELYATLKGRNLSCDGGNQELCDRLATSDVQRQMKGIEGEREPSRFDHFMDLPLEIRCHIWHLSLPPSRTIVPEYRRVYKPRPNLDEVGPGSEDANEDMMEKAASYEFRELYQEPNPVQLEVCRESREVALKRYRLVFGSANVYADLSIDTVLFSMSNLKEMCTASIGDWRLGPEIFADLAKVQTLVLCYAGWASYALELSSGDVRGKTLRGDLGALKSLKLLLLGVKSSSDHLHPFPQTRGQIRCIDLNDRNIVVKPLVISQYIPYKEDQELARSLITGFKTKELTNNEEVQDVTDIKLVIIRRFTNGKNNYNSF